MDAIVILSAMFVGMLVGIGGTIALMSILQMTDKNNNDDPY